MTAIITMLEIMASDEKVYDEVVSDKIELGLKLFAEHIGGLWY
jgi:hypothetical protein